MPSPFRVYPDEECGEDGYPHVWHRNDGSLDDLIVAMIADGDGGSLAGVGMRAGIKHVVRAQAGHRCIRCRHPFVVGSSGVMEGPQSNVKALAAEIGVTSETFDEAMTMSIADGTMERPLDPAPRRTNWSRCDELCRHGGPIRGRGIGEWEEHEGATPGQVDLLVTAGCEVEAAWRILTVHHLDEVKRNLRWWNLVALCQRCHLLIQRKVTMEQPWPWEHTDWFRPYAAAWYALRYADEELDRDATEARLEQLLELGRREESIERMPL